MTAVSVNSLTKTFGEKVAVHDLSFDVRPGVVTGFLGPNGSGKTTTLRAILGLCPPTSGSATIDGRPYAALQDPMNVVGAVLEGSTFHPGRTARNHLGVISRAARLSLDQIERVLGLVHLKDEADDRVSSYSFGMRQRLSLAAALLGDPSVLVLDEAANGLDPEGMLWFRTFLRSFAGEGRTVLLSSHVLSEVAQTIDDVVIVREGKLIARSSLAALTADSGEAVRVRTPNADQLEIPLREAGYETARPEPGMIRVKGVNAMIVGTIAAKHDVTIVDMSTETKTLEELYFELTAEGAVA